MIICQNDRLVLAQWWLFKYYFSRMKILSILAATVCTFSVFAQTRQLSSSEIYAKMEGLNVLGRVLYVAAHPDDENTRFIAYCANQKQMETAYFSFTRGDGGQNLIGSELREGLGIIRTQELLQARKVDGGIQFFSRANDFGYSKNPEETFRIWNEEEVLGDLVYVMRTFQPDVVVCRFPMDGRGGHGHHTASAILALKAFQMANDSTAYSEQLKDVGLWQPKRIVTNTGRWWNNSISAEDENVVAEDIGAYSALLGTSCNEIAALSRSMHKSQGFGSTGSRGEMLEFFEHVAGEKASTSLFDGVDYSWLRLGQKGLYKQVSDLLKNYNFSSPEASLPQLIKIQKSLNDLPNSVWKSSKIVQVNYLIEQVLGLFAEARTNEWSFAPGDSIVVDFELVARAKSNLKLISIKRLGSDKVKNYDLALQMNKPFEEKLRWKISKEVAYSTPYWLREQGTEGTYQIPSQDFVLQPQNEPEIQYEVLFDIDGYRWTKKLALVLKKNDPVKGELMEPVYLTPKVSVEFQEEQRLIANDLQPQKIDFTVTCLGASFEGELLLDLPKGWVLNQALEKIKLSEKGQKKELSVVLVPIQEASGGELKVNLKTKDGIEEALTVERIVYDHIPAQVRLKKAKMDISVIPLRKRGNLIGYIMGAGDEGPKALELMGYKVQLIQSAGEILAVNYDAIVIGVRAFNTIPDIDSWMPNLFNYVSNGGNVIAQYNTSHRLNTENLAPKDLKLSRDRVTDETAEMRFINPDHPVLNYPNKLNEADFEGWVQERGLYFPNSWSSEFQAIFSVNDPGESPSEGALLILPYGKGNYIYTGLSFFRQFPAGVPGAYRLFANLLSLKHE